MIRVHRLLFVIAVAAGLVSKFSHVHGLSVFLHLSTSSNPDFEKNMDLTAFVTFCFDSRHKVQTMRTCVSTHQRPRYSQSAKNQTRDPGRTTASPLA